MRLLLILFSLILFASCAKKPADEVDEAIDIALTYLSSNKCAAAIDVLEDVGRDAENPIYLQVLASAYACKAGFSEVVFLSSEFSKIQTGAATFMKSLTTITYSSETEADSAEYLALREGLDILLNVDSAQPSQVARELKYGTRKAGDMGVQALLLSLTQLGKFLDFYGNVDSLGNKGAGAASVDEQTATPSTCFVEYTGADAIAFLGLGGGGVCNDLGVDDGHPNMLFAPAGDLVITKRRMCEGLMLVTNIIDILDNLTLPAGSDLANLNSVTTSINTIKTGIIAADPALETLITTTSQTTCETLVAGAAEFDNLQYIYALLFEVGLP